MRTEAWRRSQRERVIHRRLSIIRNVWWQGDEHPITRQPGRLHKWNLCCSCPMCKLARRTRRPEREEWA